MKLTIKYREAEEMNEVKKDFGRCNLQHRVIHLNGLNEEQKTLLSQFQVAGTQRAESFKGRVTNGRVHSLNTL